MQRIDETEAPNTTQVTNLPASSAAIWHVAAIKRAIDTGFAYLFTSQEIELIEQGLNVLPNHSQQYLFNTIGNVESYDEILTFNQSRSPTKPAIFAN